MLANQVTRCRGTICSIEPVSSTSRYLDPVVWDSSNSYPCLCPFWVNVVGFHIGTTPHQSTRKSIYPESHRHRHYAYPNHAFQVQAILHESRCLWHYNARAVEEAIEYDFSAYIRVGFIQLLFVGKQLQHYHNCRGRGSTVPLPYPRWTWQRPILYHNPRPERWNIFWLVSTYFECILFDLRYYYRDKVLPLIYRVSGASYHSVRDVWEGHVLMANALEKNNVRRIH